MALFNTPVAGDASLNLAHQLIAAKLNVANGSDPTPIAATIATADTLLSGFAGKLPYGVDPSSATGQAMVAVAAQLDAYNKGQHTPGCATPKATPTGAATRTRAATRTASPPAVPSRTRTVTATATAAGAVPTPTSPQTSAAACPLSQGFWKNHSSQWPVSALTLGSQSYNKAELLALLRTPVFGNASLNLARQLIAAKLNLANGADPGPIAATIASADSLLSGFSGKLPYRVPSSSPVGQALVDLAGMLESYNNGRLTAVCRSEEG